MPFEIDPDAEALFKNQVDFTQTPDVTAAQQIGAAFKIENVVTNLAEEIVEPKFERDEEFLATDHIRDDELVFARELARAGSEAEMEHIRREIQNELIARELLETGPLNSFLAQTIAIVGDPTTYIGFGAGAAGRTGVGIGTRALRAGAAGAVETAAGETVLQGTQQIREIHESLGSILLGGAFGVGVGGVGGALANRAYKRGVDDFVAVMRDSFPEETGVVNPARARDAGAAAAGLTPEETVVAGKAARGFVSAAAKLRGVVAPNVELAASRNAATRDIIGQLHDSVFVREGNVRFRSAGASVESEIKRGDALRAAAFETTHQIYRGYRKAGGRINKDEFMDEVGKALRRGDVHKIPEVAELAKWYRANVFEPWKQRAIAAGMLPEDVRPKTAVSYFTRVYNVEKINARIGEFTDLVERYLRRTVDVRELASEAEYRDIARQVVNNITGTAGGRVPFINQPLARGPLKERTFNIPDKEIEDFLISDVSHVGERFLNTIIPDVTLTERFGRADLEDQIKKIDDDAKVRAEKAANETDAQAILKEAEREKDIIGSLVQIMRNQFDTPTSGAGIALRRVGRGIRQFNYLRLLGSVLLSSIPDVGRIVMEEGFTRTVGGLMAGLTGGFKLAKREAQLAGTALDVVLSTRAKAIYDLGEQYQSVSKFERGLDFAANKFGLATLLSPWNTALKSWASLVVGNRILRAVRTVAADGKISQADIEKLARAGIDEEMARRIGMQAEKFEDNNGLLVANTEEWADDGAVEAFRLALLRDVDNTIITPGGADAPIWTSREFGKMIFQFKRFAMASTGRLAASTLQAKDLAAVNGLLLMVALGGTGRALLDLAQDGEVKDRSARSWISESLDRSGALGILTEMDAISNKGLGVSPLTALAGEEASRFRSRNLLGQIGGPLAGAVQDTVNAARGAIDRDFTQGDLRKIRRLAPGQNLFYLRALLDRLEQEAGLPERQQ